MRRVAVAGLLSFAGCSLMGLDEFELVRCSDDSDCEAASRANPDPDGCGSYHCEEDGVCRLPINVEICDGEDNDCDGWIDEGVERVSPALPGAVPAVPTAFAVTSHGTAAYVAIGGDTNEGWVLTQDSTSKEPLHYESSVAVADHPCPMEAGPAACNFSQIAAAGDDLHLVFAAINQKRCAAGELRIGLSQRDTSPFSVWLGVRPNAPSQSNIAYGVDVDATTCTGATVGRAGASEPSVAVLDTSIGKPGALVAWLSAPVNAAASESTCAFDEPVSVGALGVFVPAGERGWLNGTDDGKPLILGHTSSRSAPALLALRHATPPSYLAAFAATEGSGRGIQVVAVRANGEHLSSEPLFVVHEPDLDSGNAVLAVGPESGDGLDIGLAWTAGCGEDRVLRFATMHYSDSEGFEPSRASEPQTLDVPGFVGALSVFFEPDGFANNAPNGGWSLLWAQMSPDQGRQVELARFAEDELRLLSRTTLASGAVGIPVAFRGNNSTVKYGLVQLEDEARARLEPRGGWCDVRE
jgi:hypothetical protein